MFGRLRYVFQEVQREQIVAKSRTQNWVIFREEWHFIRREHPTFDHPYDLSKAISIIENFIGTPAQASKRCEVLEKADPMYVEDEWGQNRDRVEKGIKEFDRHDYFCCSIGDLSSIMEQESCKKKDLRPGALNDVVSLDSLSDEKRKAIEAILRGE
jgi:hypothetical protein